jgi:AraC-like DNA-binding protein
LSFDGAYQPDLLALEETMSGFQFRLHPTAKDLAHCSTLLNGVAQRYSVQQYRTTLSLKSVTRGNAYYETPQGRHLVTPDSFLILNHDQEYSLEFQGPATTETLCPFFQPGLVDHVACSTGTPVASQLDEIATDARSVDFCERLYPRTGRIGVLLARLHAGVRSPGASAAWFEDSMYDLAAALVELRGRTLLEAEQFPGLRQSTRQELYRRLHRGRDFLSSCFREPITVAAAAQAAHLSPYHFHRMFRAAFGQTPMQFLQERRLNSARTLLATTDQPVTAICFAVGLESLGSFSWLFRKRFGVSPREFRLQSARSRISQA